MDLYWEPPPRIGVHSREVTKNMNKSFTPHVQHKVPFFSASGENLQLLLPVQVAVFQSSHNAPGFKSQNWQKRENL
jgi:hypothetical protein